MRTTGVEQAHYRATPGQSRMTSSGEKEHARLEDAAQQFEAMLLQQMLKPFETGESGFGEQPGGDDGGSASTLGSFGTEVVAKAISKGGGVGIARQIVQKVEAERKASLDRVQTVKVTPKDADKLR